MKNQISKAEKKNFIYCGILCFFLMAVEKIFMRVSGNSLRFLRKVTIVSSNSLLFSSNLSKFIPKSQIHSSYSENVFCKHFLVKFFSLEVIN